jgi:hypothetical protein
MKALRNAVLATVTIVAVSANSNTWAQTLLTVGQMRNDCAAMISQRDRYKAVMCSHFLHGFLMGYDVAKRETIVLQGKYETHLFCLPDNINAINFLPAAAVYVEWSDNNRKNWNWPAISGLLHALRTHPRP